MKVQIHPLFRYLLETTEANPEMIVGLSLSEAPKLGDFLADLDQDMSLDWNNRSFQGLPELRQSVLERAGLSTSCDPANVLITAGAAEANYLALMQLVQPGDEIVIERPGWPQAEVLAKAIGAGIRTVDRSDTHGWSLPIETLAEAVTDRTRLIFLTNPNNPTGQMLGAAELEAISQIADRVGAWVLVDEVYAGLEWQSDRSPSIAGLYPKGITTGSVSKALGLQGLRTGWLICRDAGLVRDALVLRENSSEIMNIMGECIAEIALRTDRYDSALLRARQDGLANLTKLNHFITSQPELSWHRPKGGLIGLVRLSDGIGGDEFARRLLTSPYRTFLIPGSAYGLPDYIRLGVGGGADSNLELGLERIARLLADW